jgi:cell division septum initiation protein DivIVA
MTELQLWQLGTSLSLAASAGLGATAWRIRQSGSQALRQAQDLVGRTRAESERTRALAAASAQRVLALEKAFAETSEGRCRAEASFDEARQQLVQLNGRLETELQSGAARDAKATRTLAEREGKVALLQSDLRFLQERLGVAMQERDSATRRAEGLAVELALARQALASFGVTSLTQADPLAAAQRPATRAALVSLWSDQNAQGVALVDGRGLALAGVGADAAVDQLATTAALVAEAEPALTEALEGPLREVSIVVGEEGRHLLRLGESATWLGLDGSARPPTHAMRLTALNLVGASARERRTPLRVASSPPAAPSRKARDIQGVLIDWAQRWSAEGVALVSPEGRPLAATTVESGRRLGNVRAALKPLYLRSARDGQPLRQLELSLGGGTDMALGLRMVGNRPTSLTVVALAPFGVPREALDELVDSLRWMAMQGGEGDGLAADAA